MADIALQQIHSRYKFSDPRKTRIKNSLEPIGRSPLDTPATRALEVGIEAFHESFGSNLPRNFNQINDLKLKSRVIKKILKLGFAFDGKKVLIKERW